MTGRTLGSLQVAALLVSASYGIGFLFGSGELAIRHGMAGSVYGLATALGMFALALVARPIWAAGVPVWTLFGRAYGPGIQRAVALLSVVWMAGVLAAQIHGGVAVARLLGVPDSMTQLVVLALIYGASRLDLCIAASVFALCLLASALMLAYALFVTGGIDLYLHSVPSFARDLSTFDPLHLVAMTLAVGLLVCTGADYHQFVLAARRPSVAVMGCVLAGLALILIGFLPPAVVVTMQGTGALADVADARQVVPFLLARVAGSMSPSADKLMLIALSAAALGSGAAILRAMTAALGSAATDRWTVPQALYAIAALALGAALAARGEGIVQTMVSVNVVYIAAVGVCFAALLAGIGMRPVQAGTIMVAGGSASLAVYLAGWAGFLAGSVDFFSLIIGLGVSLATAGFSALKTGFSLRRSVGRGS